MLVADSNLYPESYLCTQTTSVDGVVTEKRFYNVPRAEITAINWSFKWIFTAIDSIDTDIDQDVEIVFNPKQNRV